MRLLKKMVLGFALVVGATAAAQGPGRIPMRAMGPEDGLANPLVNCMAQSGDGYIWVGTWSGLFRFDGHRFESVNWAQGGAVTDMSVDAHGRLWVGSERYLGVREESGFRILGQPEGLPSEGAYRRVMWTPQGIYLIRDGRCYRGTAGDRFEMVTPRVDVGALQDLAWAPRLGGVLALGTRSLSRLEGDEVIPVPKLAKEDALIQVAEDGEGDLWLLSRQGVWRRSLKGEVWQDMRHLVPRGVPFRMSGGIGAGVVLHHPEGARWVSGDAVEIYPPQPFQSAPGVGASLIDREGTLWLGAYGVQRTLGGGLWRTYGEREGLPAPGAWGYLRDRKGRLWVGNGKGLCLATPKGWKVLLAGNQILSVSEDANGGLWATGGPQDAVHRVDPDTFAVESFRLPTTAPTQFRAVVTSTDPDHVWVFPRWQVPGWAFHGAKTSGHWRWSPVRLNGQPLSAVNYMARAPGGRVFLTAPGGVYEVRGSEAQLVMARPKEWAPQYLSFSREGELFLGQNESHAILRFQPEGQGFRPSGRIDVPMSREASLIFSMKVDDRGYVWAGTSEGVVRYQLSTGQALRWTSGEGLPNNDCNALGIYPEPNGDTWVSTAGGIGLYLGSKERPARDLPAPLITRVRVRGVWKDWTPGPLVLPSGTVSLEFHAQSLHFGLQGRIRYQMRIQGLNTEWEDLESGDISLRGLAHGDYRLEVRSYLPEGLRSPVTQVDFTISPAWWQTGAARFAGVFLIACLGAMGFRYWTRHLHQKNQNLERMVAERTDEVARINTELLLAREVAERANRSKSAFLANMSHELRTPLNAILLYCELLVESAIEDGRSQDETDILRVRSAGNHLLTLINGLLDLAKIEAGRMPLHIETVPLAPFLGEVLATLKPLAESKGNALTQEIQDPELVVSTDSTKFRQILFNLINNACKFTEDGRIHIKVGSEGRKLRVEISDSGIGMTPDQVGRIFQDFVQATDDTSRKYGGTGLGLTISRRLTELMGGRITVDSSPGQGTTFKITLPLEVQSKEAGPAAFAMVPSSEAGRPKALLVDADAVHRDFLSRFLGREGYWVASATGGEEGLALARQIRPRLIVMSLAIAAEEGWELLVRVQQDPHLHAVPVLLETFSQDGERATGFFAPEMLRLPLHSGAIGTLLGKRREDQGQGHLLALCSAPESRTALSVLAERHGWTFACHTQVEGLRSALSQRLPDQLLIEMHGSTMEAWMLLQELQQDFAWKDIPTAAFTLREHEGAEEGLAQWNARKLGLAREAWVTQLAGLLRSK
jgi:signal transduction histidine kinase/ligand-binding sensor domain-containing protein/CheY-like chemotaxis protein